MPGGESSSPVVQILKNKKNEHVKKYQKNSTSAGGGVVIACGTDFKNKIKKGARKKISKKQRIRRENSRHCLVHFFFLINTQKLAPWYNYYID